MTIAREDVRYKTDWEGSSPAAFLTIAGGSGGWSLGQRPAHLPKGQLIAGTSHKDLSQMPQLRLGVVLCQTVERVKQHPVSAAYASLA